jgi:hypothetical protein
MLHRQMVYTGSVGSAHAPTHAPAASLWHHSWELIARRRSSCVGPPHSYTHAASTDGIYRLFPIRKSTCKSPTRTLRASLRPVPLTRWAEVARAVHVVVVVALKHSLIATCAVRTRTLSSGGSSSSSSSSRKNLLLLLNSILSLGLRCRIPPRTLFVRHRSEVRRVAKDSSDVCVLRRWVRTGFECHLLMPVAGYTISTQDALLSLGLICRRPPVTLFVRHRSEVRRVARDSSDVCVLRRWVRTGFECHLLMPVAGYTISTQDALLSLGLICRSPPRHPIC